MPTHSNTLASTRQAADAPITGAGSEDAPQTGGHRILLFIAGGRTFAAPAADVREIVPFRRPTRLPGAPAHVSGILNLRGTLVTVIDLARRLGLSDRLAENRCIVLLQREGRPVGVTVDEVLEVVAVNEDMIEPAGAEQSLSELASGLDRLDTELVLLLDLRLLVKQVLLS